MSATYKRTLVTSALPYANGPVHIGHLAGCYLPSDIFVRYKRSKGEDILFICGSDEHGVPITIKAKKEGVTPQDVVNKYHKMMGDSFKEFGISLIFIHVLQAKHIIKRPLIFLKNYMIKGFLQKKLLNSIMTKKLSSF